MEALLAIVIGVLFASTVFLFLSRSFVRVILGIFMISNATHLLILTSGRSSVLYARIALRVLYTERDRGSCE